MLAVKAWEPVNLRVKQWKCANHSVFSGVVAPGVAKGGSCQKTEGVRV